MRRLNLTSTTSRDGTKETKGNKPDQTSVITIKSECKEKMNSVGETGGKITKRQHSRSNSHSGSDTYVFAKPPSKPLSADTNRRKISSNSNDSDTFIVYNDEAINVSNVYGGKDKIKGDNCQRLLIISSKVRNSSVIRHALLSNVIYVQYNYEVHSIDEILVFIEESIGTKKVASVAMVLSCNQSAIQITAKDDKTLCGDKIHDLSIQLFFTRLIELCIDTSHTGHRLDLLALSAYQHLDIPLLTHELQDWTGVTVGFAKDFVGNDIGNFKKDDSKSVVGDMYFRLEKLRFWSGRHQQSLAGFEKIRTVGKGAYGAAVLYKKKDDDSVVILKEINMHDLSAAERHLALNEVNVLAMLDHPNIISYYDSFEEDGVLMIEMEYADGGTLKQFLYQQEQTNLDEKVVLEMFQQIVAAIRYIHEHKILHRDLKTDNIFLTKEGIIKVGDFGISKMMSSAQGANTVLGTPYYISPEMCEGKPYSFKSDIWALGCILYEMACLQKTFEGTNLPALVNKIMKGQFAPVKDIYSLDFRGLVLDMLQNDPDKRPDATELMYHKLPPLIAKYHEQVSDPEEELNENENANKKIKMRSVMYYLEASTGELTCITDLPPRLKIKNAAVGPDHVIVVTTEEQVYSWGEGSKGQLGHGNTESKGRPELIEALNGKSIVAAQCGDGFSLFRSENGLVLTCGDGSKGCLGHGDWSDTFKPRLIEALLSVDVSSVTCGPNHVVGVSSTGEVYTWGQGSDGKLGLGDDENYCQPMLVTIDEPVISVDVRCGIDGTMILTDIGSVFACGSNENNKLGLNNRQGFLMAMKNIFNKTEVEGRNVLTPVRSLARHRVIDISMGAYHSAVIVESGHVYMFGRNSEGQLATGNIKPSNTIVEVKALHDKYVNKVVCGEHFTVASTKDHELYYWGLRYTVPSSLDDSTTSRSSTNGSLSNTSNITGKDDIKLEDVTPRKASGKSGHHRHSSSASVSSVTGTESFTQTTSQDSGIVLNKESTEITGQISGESQSPADSGAPSTCDSSSGFRPLSSVPHRSLSAGSRENVKDKEKDSNKDESVILLEPKELIRIKQVNEKVLLGNIFIHGENLFVQVETTAPPPRRKALKKRSLRRRLNVGADGTREVSASSREGGDEYSSEASEIDSQGSIPAWLRQELMNCNDEDSNDVYEADDTSDQSSGDETRKAIIDSSMSSIQVNKDLSPVKSPSKRRGKFEETQKFLRTPREVVTKDTSTRNRTLSNNSTAESGADGLVYDSSSSEPIQGKITPRNAILKVSTVTTRKASASSLVKPKSVQSVKSSAKIKSHGKGKGKGFDADIKEQLEARGFVSDVTVKRREEALLGELEVMKEERAKAERLIQEMEGEQQLRLEQMKKEAQKHVEEREKGLQNEVENLRKQLEYQSSLLHSNQLTVQQLQEQLNRLQIDASSNTSTPRNSDATSSLSHKSSKVCSVQ